MSVWYHHVLVSVVVLTLQIQLLLTAAEEDWIVFQQIYLKYFYWYKLSNNTTSRAKRITTPVCVNGVGAVGILRGAGVIQY
jgi:hypothetical protein